MTEAEARQLKPGDIIYYEWGDGRFYGEFSRLLPGNLLYGPEIRAYFTEQIDDDQNFLYGNDYPLRCDMAHLHRSVSLIEVHPEYEGLFE